MTLSAQEKAKLAKYFHSSQTNEESVMGSPVTDIFMRKALINAAESMEKQVAKGLINPETTVRSTTKWGLQIRCGYDPGGEKPDIFTFDFDVNPITLQSWIREHQYMLEGPISFTSRGIQVVFNSSRFSDWKKMVFCIDTTNTAQNPEGKQWLDLFDHRAVFQVYRDTFNRSEWIVTRIK